MTPPLTVDERKILGQYVRDTADKIGLRDWHFDIGHEPCEEHYAAQIGATYGKRTARITFAADFRAMTLAEQREAVVHELLHVPMEPFSWYLHKTMPRLVGEPSAETVREAYDQRVEEAVDCYAKAFAPGFPLIKWPK